jgi:DNA-binding transcriptional MocR family regulator
MAGDTPAGAGLASIIQFEHRPGILDLGWGHPLPALLPVDGWARAVAAASRDFGWQALTYGRSAGPGPLVDWLAEHLSRLEAGGTTPRQTFVTAGASHALSLVTGLLTKPGDTVLVDSPTYHLVFPIFADHGVRLVSVPADDDGVDPVALAGLLGRLGRVRLLYLVPTFGNPTGRSLPAERRQALVRLAQRERVTVVEDDTYRELVYDGPAPPSLWRLAEGSGVVRIGTFSKTVAPGLRLGWINADPAVVRRLAGLGYVDSGGGVNHAAALAMASFATSGAYDEHVAKIRGEYRRQRDALTTAVPQAPVPAGGWFTWLRLPPGVRAADLLSRAERNGVSFVPGPRFHLDGNGSADRIRLSFSHLPPETLAVAGARLAETIAATEAHG